MAYKEMYLTIVRETESAIQLLINAQKQAEEMYLAHESSVIHIVEDNHSYKQQPRELT